MSLRRLQRREKTNRELQITEAKHEKNKKKVKKEDGEYSSISSLYRNADDEENEDRDEGLEHKILLRKEKEKNTVKSMREKGKCCRTQY